MDTTFYEEDYVFNLRVACVVRCKNKILIQKEKGIGHYTYAGGRPHVMEDTISAGIREMKEETGLDVEFVRFLAIVENFFSDKKRKFHELLMIIEYKFKDNKIDENYKVKNIEEDKDIKYEWVEIDELKRIYFLPEIGTKIDYNKPFSHYIERNLK